MKRVILGFFVMIVGMMVSCMNAETPNVKDINQSQFKTLVGNYANGLNNFKFVGKKPVVVDIYATWCGPCRRLSPILEELAREYKGKVDFYKVDLDENRELGAAFGVQAIPLVIIFPVKGQPQFIEGLRPKAEIKLKIDQCFSGGLQAAK